MSASPVLSAFSRPAPLGGRSASPPSSTSTSPPFHPSSTSPATALPLLSFVHSFSSSSSSDSPTTASPSPSPFAAPLTASPASDSASAVGQAKVGGFSLSAFSPLLTNVLDRPSPGLATPRTSLLISSSPMHGEHEAGAVESPLSVDASTGCSSAASSRAPSPLHAPPSSPAQTPKRTSNIIQVGSPAFAAHSPALSPLVQPLSPASPANSSDSLSSSSSSSVGSFTYGKEPAGSRSCGHHHSSAGGGGGGGALRGAAGRTKRVPLSQTQKAVLEECFLSNHYPTREEKTALGQRIHLSGDKVHKWYDNRRTKLNKDGKMGGRAGDAAAHAVSMFDEPSSQRLHPYATFSIKPRSPLSSVPPPILHLYSQQLQQLQLQQQQQMQLQQQLLQAGAFHTFLHPTTFTAQHQQQPSAQQQQQQQLQLAAAQQHQKQQQQQAAAAQEAVLRQMTLNGVDHRLAPTLSQSQLSFLQSASISPLLQVPPVGALQSTSTGLAVHGFQVKPSIPPAAAPNPTSAFHAVGQSGGSVISPLINASRPYPLSSAMKLTSPSPSSLGADVPGVGMLMLPAPPLSSLAFRSLSTSDVPAFNAATYTGSVSAPLTSLPSDPTPPLFTCTPTANGFSLFRPHPPAPLK